MFRSAFGAATVICALGTADADARLISATLPAPDDAALAALHKPTGCQARVTLRGETILKAKITDPACLPKGVKERSIPGSRFDFVVTTPK